MKRFLLSILFAFSVAAQSIPGGVPFGGFISPNAAGNSYAVTKTRYQLGGVHTWMTNFSQLTDTTALTGLPVARREAGMVSVIGGIPYRLSSDLVTWTAESVGPSSGIATNVAQLLSTPAFTNLSSVQVLGYYSSGDGGFGNYIWTTNVSNTNAYGGKLAYGSGAWQLEQSGVVNVAQFGASTSLAGTSNTTRIQAANDWAYAFTVGIPEVVVGPGSYSIGAPGLTISAGKFGGLYAPDLNSVAVGTRFVAVTGMTNDVFTLIGSDSRKPILHDFYISGTGESGRRNPKTITSVSSRKTFFVAPGDVPASWSGVASWPFYGYCFFYSNEGQYLGSGVVQTVNAGTGQCDLYLASDLFATQVGTSGLLTSGWQICFSPVTTEGGSTFPDPTAAGPAGIRVIGNGYTMIENVHPIYCHTALAIGTPQVGFQTHEFNTDSSRFASIASRSMARNSDQWSGRTRIQGRYLSEPGFTYTNSLEDAHLQVTYCGIWMPGYTSSYLDMLNNWHLYGMIGNGTYHMQGSQWNIDNTAIGGIMWLDGPTSRQETQLAVNNLLIRPDFITDRVSTYYTNKTSAISTFGSGTFKIDVGVLMVETPLGATNQFDYVWSGAASANNGLTYASLANMSGARELYNSALSRPNTSNTKIVQNSGTPPGRYDELTLVLGGTSGWFHTLRQVNEVTLGSGVGRWDEYRYLDTNSASVTRYQYLYDGSITYTSPTNLLGTALSSRFVHYKTDDTVDGSEVRIGYGTTNVPVRLDVRGDQIGSYIKGGLTPTNLFLNFDGGLVSVGAGVNYSTTTNMQSRLLVGAAAFNRANAKIMVGSTNQYLGLTPVTTAQEQYMESSSMTNNGLNALTTGDEAGVIWNTTLKNMRIWNGTSWSAPLISSNGDAAPFYVFGGSNNVSGVRFLSTNTAGTLFRLQQGTTASPTNIMSVSSGGDVTWTGGNQTLATAGKGIEFTSGGPKLLAGSGTPEAAVTAPVGSLFLRSNGAAGTAIYGKATGSGNTGWIPYKPSLVVQNTSLSYASILTLAVGTATVTVTGAAVGDSVVCNPRAALTTGLVKAYDYVSAADTVTIVLMNVTLGSLGTTNNWDVNVIKN